MIRELKWDSIFFNRKIGELKISQRFPKQIEYDLKDAKDRGYKYLICRIKYQDTHLIKYLESLGFYLIDISVIWEGETKKLLYSINKPSDIKKSIKISTSQDIPDLKDLSKSLFLKSRFYNDPFYSKEEADNLHKAWVENSVKGQDADIVFCMDKVGFITCKKINKDIGRIILLGIKRNLRGKGIGKSLVMESLKWFVKKRINIVKVKTQLRNVNAMNFYLNLGFYVGEYEIVFGKIL